jgi:hypothetical protein
MKVPSNKSLEPTRLTKASFVSVSSGAAQLRSMRSFWKRLEVLSSSVSGHERAAI